MKSKYAWVTKHAIARGVYKCRVIEIKGTMVVVDWPSGINKREYFHGRDWYHTEEEALTRARDMAKKRVQRLRREADELETYEPSVIEPK